MAFLKSKVFRFLASAGIAALIYFLCPPCFNRTHLLAILAGLVVMINLNMYLKRVPLLTHAARIAVGGLFIFSGFIKANDPVGFSYKLEEYFEVFGQGFSCDMKAVSSSDHLADVPCAQDVAKKETVAAPKQESMFKGLWEFFHDHSLFLAIILVAVEMVLGVFLLLGFQTRWTVWLLMSMIVFFSFLTFYSACCNKVTSCGCFGDAIKLTPWESFWKDLILLLLVTLLIVTEENIKPIFKNSIVNAGLVGIFTFASFALPIYTNRHMPLIDYRPYKIGVNWLEASKNKNPRVDKCIGDSVYIEYYYYKGNDSSHPRKFLVDSLPDSTWNYYCRYDVVVRKGNCEATIKDFNLADPDSMMDHTDSLLRMKGIQFYLVMYDINKADKSMMGRVNDFYALCQKDHIPFNALAPVDAQQIEAFRKETHAQFPFFVVDQTALKTVIRSNPGLIMLKDGVCTAMWHSNDFPAYNDVMQTYKK